MCNSFITLDELENSCAKYESTRDVAPNFYQPVEPHIFFFVLVWSQKRRQAFKIETDMLVGFCADRAEVRVTLVAKHLGIWGEIVSGLQRGDEHEWVAVREQMYKSVSRRNCTKEIQEDSYQEAQLKVFEILRKIPDAQLIYSNQSIVQFVIERQDSFTNIYDFGSPLYYWAQTITINELNQALGIPTEDDLWGLSPEDEPVSSDPVDTEQAFKNAIVRLTNLFERMLTEVEKLTPKPRQVVYTTLAARQQLWLMLETLGMEQPQSIPAKMQPTDDSAIAGYLGMTENNVRVHRSKALKVIMEIDRELGELLQKLMDPHLW